MATEVLVERTSLDDGVVMIFKEFGRRVRVAFDPRRITEAVALALLCQYLPKLAGAMNVVHRTDA